MRALVLLGLSCVLAIPLHAQTFVPLRSDGNGVPALQARITVKLRGVPRADALRELARRSGVRVAFDADLRPLAEPVSVVAHQTTVAEAFLRVVGAAELELRVSPGGHLVLAPRRPTNPPAPGLSPVHPAPAVVELAEVVVTASRFAVDRVGASAPHTLAAEELEAAPQPGEDVFRLVGRLPGVSASDLSARFHVRGGDSDELLVRLDGLELVDPFHLRELDGGALSIVDLQAIGSLTLITGGFPADYGDRLSGVFEMHSARAPIQGVETSAGLSLTHARLTSRGGFASGRGEWLLSARRGHLDLLLDRIDLSENEELIPSYGDFLGKLQYELGRHRLSVHGLYAGDQLLGQDGELSMSSRYRNGYLWANWGAELSNGIRLHSVASTGDLDWLREGTWSGNRIGTRVDDRRDFRFAGIRQEAEWSVTSWLLGRAGWEWTGLRAQYDYSSRNFRSSQTSTGLATQVDSIRIRTDPAGHEAAAFVAARIRPWSPLTVEAGGRVDRQSYSGDRTWSPRVNLAYSFRPGTSLKAAWGIYHQSQPIHALQVHDGIEHFYAAARAEHRLVAIEHEVAGTSLRADLYQRLATRVQPRFVNLDRGLDLFPEVEDDRVLLRPSEGKAVGLELFAKRSAVGRVGWYASYAVARAEEEIDGRWVPRHMDQRHALRFGGHVAPTPVWRMSAAWEYHSGWPITERSAVPGQRENATGGEFGPLYASRLPGYHRLDARIARSWAVRRGRVSAFIDLFNVYDRQNPRAYSYGYLSASDASVRLRRNFSHSLPFLPSFGFTWEF